MTYPDPMYMERVAPNCHNQVPILSAIGRGPVGPQGPRGVPGPLSRKDFDTVADMIADESLVKGDICHTLGFHEAEDGGAAWYKVESDGTANGMDVLALTSGGVAVLQVTESYVTPEMFGAYGDGVHDDTDELSKAIEYVLDGKIEFKLLGNTYTVSSTIEINISDASKKSLLISGVGMKSNISSASSFTGDCVIELNCSASNVKNIVFDNFKITSNAAGVDCIRLTSNSSIGQLSKFTNMWFMDGEKTSVKCGLYCPNATCFVVENCAFYNFENGAGIVIEYCYSSHIVNSGFVFNKYGIYLGGGSDVTIDKCRIDENDYGIYCNDCTNDLHPTTRPTGKWVFNSTIYGLNILNSRFENNSEYAILLSAWLGVASYGSDQKVLIDGNYFTGLGCDKDTHQLSTHYKAISVSRINGLTISNNDFRGWIFDPNNPIYTQNIETDADCGSVTFENNFANINNSNEFGGGKSNYYLPNNFINILHLSNNIELNQTSRTVTTKNENRAYIDNRTVSNGVLDVTDANVFIINESAKPTITSFTDSFEQIGISKEITLISGAKGFALTPGYTMSLSSSFDVSTYGKSITLKHVRISGVGWLWVETGRNV